MSTDVLNLRALNRALLARQMLLEPSPLPVGPGRADAVVATIEHLAGLQAQAPFPPYYGLWSLLAIFGRQLAGLDTAALAEAGRALVDAEPRTFGELGGLLAPDWPGHPPNALAQGVRTLVPLVQVPPR